MKKAKLYNNKLLHSYLIKWRHLFVLLLIFSCGNRKIIRYFEYKSDKILDKYSFSTVKDTIIKKNNKHYYYKDGILIIYSEFHNFKRYYLYYDSLKLYKISKKTSDSTAFPLILINTTW